MTDQELHPDDDAKGFGWGVWSTGSIAAAFAEDLSHVPGAVRAAVCSRNSETAKDFAAAHGFAASYRDADAFLADRDVEAVYIASPHAMHCEQALAAIAAGKPVLIEKPIAMNAAEAERIADAAAKAGVFAMEALWTRFLPAVQRTRALIGEGVIGSIARAEASLVFHRPFDPDHRLFNPTLGGGALLDLGVYPLSLATFLFGEPVLEEARWTAAPTGVDMNADLNVRCAGVPVRISVGFVEDHKAESDNHFMVFGSDGALRIDRHFLAAQSLTVWDKPLAAAPVSGGWSERLAGRLPVPGRKRLDFAGPSRGLNFQAEAVQAAIIRGETGHPTMPLTESAAVLAVIEQALGTPPTRERG